MTVYELKKEGRVLAYRAGVNLSPVKATAEEIDQLMVWVGGGPLPEGVTLSTVERHTPSHQEGDDGKSGAATGCPTAPREQSGLRLEGCHKQNR